ncbi:MAG: GNAT family N-acetyltransferase [Candidatus Cloacimonetes bacterium]|nr:GNAT family N-acetyltransferase [Candidatus Cloacimonadota bacterium]
MTQPLKVQAPLRLGFKRRPNRMKNFRAHIPVYLEKRNFIVKTADSTEELRAALRLRHEVFLEELLQRKKKSGFDVDRFDKTCDHLLIIDKRNNMVIGTYRLQSSLHTKRWYTATEFNIKQITKKLPGNKLELGRACVHPDHRNGVTIALLWAGIHAYMTASQTEYLFGCSSINTTDNNDIKGIYHFLREGGYLTKEYRVRPRGKFKVPGFDRYIRKYKNRFPAMEVQVHKDKIPPLLNSYLKAGAKVCGNPALDRNFRCIDFLTLLSVQDIGEVYHRKYKSE